MKAARRHELRDNDLAHAIETGRAYLKDHGGRVGLIVLAAVVTIVLVALSMRSRAAATEDAWRMRGELSFDDPEVGKESLEQLLAITNDATDEGFVLAGMMDQGVLALSLAGQGDDPPDDGLNEMARGAFVRLLERFPDNPLAVGVAYCGLATVEENSFVLDGDPAHKERAREYLEAITVDNPALAPMPFFRMAQDRLENIEATFSPVAFGPPLESPPEAATGSTITIPPPGLAGQIELPTRGSATTKPKSEEEAESDQPDEAGKPESPEEPEADQPGKDQPGTDQPGTDDPDPQKGSPKAGEPR